MEAMHFPETSLAQTFCFCRVAIDCETSQSFSRWRLLRYCARIGSLAAFEQPSQKTFLKRHCH